MDIVTSQDFLKLTIGANVGSMSEDYPVMCDIIAEYIDGKNLSAILKSKEWTYRRFIFNISRFPVILNTFEEAKQMHDSALRERLVQVIDANSPADWKAAAWLLERMFPKEFGKTIDVTTTDIKVTSPEAVNSVLQKYREQQKVCVSQNTDDAPQEP